MHYRWVKIKSIFRCRIYTYAKFPITVSADIFAAAAAMTTDISTPRFSTKVMMPNILLLVRNIKYHVIHSFWGWNQNTKNRRPQFKVVVTLFPDMIFVSASTRLIWHDKYSQIAKQEFRPWVTCQFPPPNFVKIWINIECRLNVLTFFYWVFREYFRIIISDHDVLIWHAWHQFNRDTP